MSDVKVTCGECDGEGIIEEIRHPAGGYSEQTEPSSIHSRQSRHRMIEEDTRMETITRHATECNRAFGRRDENCPRCQELAQGAAPRRGWGQSRYNGARERHPVRTHVCRPECGVVCTFGEW